jgi:hypothetical protein
MYSAARGMVLLPSPVTTLAGKGKLNLEKQSQRHRITS